MSEGHQFRSPSVRFSEDVVPLGDIKVNPGALVRRVRQSGRPMLLTSRGRGVAVVQSLSRYEEAEDERSFLRAVIEGLASAEEGRELTLAEVKASLLQE